MKINIKRFISVVLTILFFLLPFSAIENKENFTFSIILWPIVASALGILKIFEFNNFNFKKSKIGVIGRYKDENAKENKEINNKTTEENENK